MLSPFLLGLGISVIFSLILPGCGTRPQSEGPLFGTGVFHPPPKPGASISQTQMCECTACEPSNCCDGPEEGEAPTCTPSADSNDEQVLCADSLRSCASRCAREVWRVKVGEECSSKRPAHCCRAG